MNENDPSGQIGRDTTSDGIDCELAGNDWFSSLNYSQCVGILHLAQERGWTRDFVVKSQLDLTDGQLRDCLSLLAEDGFIALESPNHDQYIALTARGSWAATTQVDNTRDATEVAVK
ncbi:hypothetical protein [Halodesulfurarchaeum formicicum]|uniref:hypothetical protein n=1 Tax=Halodesulfurarchaeum formicicum TaxID=1873524 RepID=UPI000903D1A8|nr:hypothetical protein [Halodesulfurarchaeum formicicum]